MKRVLTVIVAVCIIMNGCSSNSSSSAPVYVQPDFTVEPLPILNLSLFSENMTDEMFTDREKQLIDNMCMLASYSERQFYILTELKKQGDKNNQEVYDYMSNISFRQWRSMNYSAKVRMLKNANIVVKQPTKTIYPQQQQRQAYIMQQSQPIGRRSTTQPLPGGETYVKDFELK